MFGFASDGYDRKGRRFLLTKKPDRNRFYDIAINKMVNEALAQKEEEFAQKYADASDEELWNTCGKRQKN